MDKKQMYQYAALGMTVAGLVLSLGVSLIGMKQQQLEIDNAVQKAINDLTEKVTE